MHLEGFWSLNHANLKKKKKRKVNSLCQKASIPPPSYPPIDPSHIFSGAPPGCLRIPPGEAEEGPEEARKGHEKRLWKMRTHSLQLII